MPSSTSTPEARHGYDSDPRMPVQRTRRAYASRCELVERGGRIVNAATNDPLRPPTPALAPASKAVQRLQPRTDT